METNPDPVTAAQIAINFLINFFIFSLDNLYFLIYNMFCCEAVMFYKDVRLAQLDRAFGYEPKGRVFESLRGHQLNVQEAVADATASFFVPYHLIQKL